MKNNKIAFGLCEQHNIELPKDAAPRDAWEALKSGRFLRRITMNNEKNNLKEIGRRFVALAQEKGWNKEEIKRLMICIECTHAVEKFGDKYTSCTFVIDKMKEYDDANKLFVDLIEVLTGIKTTYVDI